GTAASADHCRPAGFVCPQPGMPMVKRAVAPSDPGAAVELRGAQPPDAGSVLTPDALAFVAALERRFGPEIDACLQQRRQRLERLADGECLDLLPETREIREREWQVAPAPS